MARRKFLKCDEAEISTNRVEFWSEYLKAAHEFSNVTLVCGDRQSKATHALLLASFSDLLRRLLLEVYSTEENMVILLPDHSMEELEMGFQTLLAGGQAGQGIIEDLGIAVKEATNDVEANMLNVAYETKQKCKRSKNPFDNKGQPQIIQQNFNNINQFQCQKCSSSFDTKAGLESHVSVAHDSEWNQYIEKGIDRYNCKLCNKTFSRKNSTRIHIACVHNIGSNIKCSECPKVCFYQSQLEHHMLVHSEERKFVCDECGMNLKSVNHVKVHKTSKHISEEEKIRLFDMFSCNICEKKYLNKARLEVHAGSHKEKTIPCNKCDKKFKIKDDLRLHNKRKHLGIKPKKLTEEELEKKRASVRVCHVKRRLKQKQANGGMLRTGEERIKFNEYMKNWSAKRREQNKAKTPKL